MRDTLVCSILLGLCAPQRQCIGLTFSVKFSTGWSAGSIKGLTQARGLNFVVVWDDDPSVQEKRLLSLDCYGVAARCTLGVSWV